MVDDRLVIAMPRDGGRFVLDTDASVQRIAGVLQQEVDGRLRVIEYAGKALSAAEAKWPIQELEAYANVYMILYFREFLWGGAPFVVRTDHESLKWLWKCDKTRVARWALRLQEFNFEVRHRAGAEHLLADIFTRNRDVSDEEDEMTDYISWKYYTAGAVTQFAAERDPVDAEFPSVCDVREAQEQERIAGTLPKELQIVGGTHVYMDGAVYMPAALRQQVLFYFHFGRAGAHSGVNRTYRRLRQVVWWSGMREDIQNSVRQCLTCARRQTIPLRREPHGNLLACAPMEVVAIDCIGPFEQDANDRPVMVMTMVDHFTRIAEAVPIVDRATDVTWSIFRDRWLSTYGSPRYLLSDNAKEYLSDKFVMKCKTMGIQKIFIAPYHPQGNGICESFHQIFMKMISALDATTNWSLEEKISTALMAFKSTPHISTGETPYKLLTGNDFVSPMMQEYATVTNANETDVDRQLALAHLRRLALDRMVKITADRHEHVSPPQSPSRSSETSSCCL